MTPVDRETKNVISPRLAMKLWQDLPLGAVSPRPGGSFAKGFGGVARVLTIEAQREDKTIFD